MEILNDDCLMLIFKELPIMDRLNCSKVCIKWYEMIKTTQVFSLVIVRSVTKEDAMNTINRKYLNRGDFEEILDLWGHSVKYFQLGMESRKHYDHDISSGPCKIKMHVNDHEFSHVFSFLCIQFSDMIDLLKRHCTNFGYMDLNISGPNKSRVLNMLSEIIYSTEQLSLLRVAGHDYDEIDNFWDTLATMDKSWNHLEKLTVEHILLKAEGGLRLFLQKTFNLQELSLCGCKYLTDQYLEAISLWLTQLKVLTLQGPFMKDETHVCLNIKSISKLANLEHLSLIGFSQSLTHDGIAGISSGCKKIKKLVLQDCSLIMQEDMDMLISSLPELEYLEVTNLNVNYIKPHGNLQTLKLLRCPNLSEDALCGMIQQMPCLTVLFTTGELVPKKVLYCVILTALSRNQVIHVINDPYFKLKLIRVYKTDAGLDNKQTFDFYCSYLCDIADMCKNIKDFVTRELPSCSVTVDLKDPVRFYV